jgi:hypothetical protein
MEWAEMKRYIYLNNIYFYYKCNYRQKLIPDVANSNVDMDDTTRFAMKYKNQNFIVYL